MFKYLRTITLALVLSALFVFLPTSSVFAEDGANNAAAPAPTEVVTTDVATAEPMMESTPLPTEEPAEELIPTEVAGTEATPEPEVIATEVPAVEATQEPVLTETPAAEETPAAGDGIVLADESGDPLPLTSTETSELLQGGDPYFMVGTQKYAWVFDPDGDPLVGSSWQSACPVGTSAGSTCFEATSTNAINAALTYITDHGLVPTDKKIYVEGGWYDESVNIDGTGNIFYRQLTGLIGVDGSGVTAIYGDVSVSGTLYGFTLSGFTFYGGVNISSNTGTLTLKDLDVENAAGDGIVVDDQKGAVIITDVESSDNLNSGLMVNNGTTTAAYPVTITNSEFADNGTVNSVLGYGAHIISNGTVTLNGVSASRNNGDGMLIETRSAVTVKYGDFSNNVYSDNDIDFWGGGLYIYNQTTPAAVVLENIQANANEDAGIWIATRGPVTAKILTANQNGWEGILIDNDYSSGGIFYPTTVAISDGDFNNNYHGGLKIYATGNVTLSFINANGNGSNGVFIDTCLWNGTACQGTGSVSILNPYQVPMVFSFNGYNFGGSGLNIASAGAVTITGISAYENVNDGVTVKNNYTGKVGAVTINALPATDSIVSQSVFNRNDGYGIKILSNGAVAINGTPTWTVRVDRNGLGGIAVGESTAPAGSSVTIKGIDLLKNNGDAVAIYNKGAITLDTLWVNNPWGTDMYTSGMGFNLNNSIGTGAVTITNASASYTGSYGFDISSKGAVTLKNVWTYRTGMSGIYIDNSEAAAAQPVTINDADVQQAHGDGIEVYSKGLVTINGASSYNNSGMHLDQNSVTVYGNAFDSTWFDFTGTAGTTVSIAMDYNGYAEIQLISAYSNTELWSSSSSYWGETLAASDIVLPDDGQYYILMRWTSDWQDDNSYALNFVYGDTVSSEADAPVFNGIYVDNTLGTADVNMGGTANNTFPWVSNNSGNGVVVLSNGNIKLLTTTVEHNQQTGVALLNYQAATPKTVTADKLYISDSGDNGLFIFTIGNVALTNIISKQNAGTGIFADNCQLDPSLDKCRGAGSISLVGNNNEVSSNQSNGIEFYTIGLVTLNNINASDNWGTGLKITGPLYPVDLAAKPITGGVTLTTTNGNWNTINNNWNHGADIFTYGPVSLQNLDVSSNRQKGIYVENSLALSAKPVTLNNVGVWNSGDTGIEIKSMGTVTLNGVSSSNNYDKNYFIFDGQTIEGLAAGGLNFSFFVVDSTALDIDMYATDFSGEMTLYDEYNNYVAGTSGSSTSIDTGSLAEGTYRLSISPRNSQPFYYRLSIDDPTPDTVENSFITSVTGIFIDNTYGVGDVILGKSTTGSITYVTSNTGDGIVLFTNGNVKLSTTYVANNLGNGINVQAITPAKSVTITDITVENNGGFGIGIKSKGPVMWTTGQINDNNSFGVSIDNADGNAPVTVSRVDVRNSSGRGMKINSKGTVTLSDLDLVENYGYGLYVSTNGAISLARVNASSTGEMGLDMGVGAYLDNAASSTLIPAGVSITDSDFRFNVFGLNVNSKGIVTLTGVNTEYNYDSDRYIYLNDTLRSYLPGNNWIYDPTVDGYRNIGQADWNFTVQNSDVNPETGTYDITIYLNILSGSGYGNLYDFFGNYVAPDYTDNGIAHYLLTPDYYTFRVQNTLDNPLDYELGLNADPAGTNIIGWSRGAKIITQGNVTVAPSTTRTSSNFNNNGSDGLLINTAGSITISKVNSYGNHFYGLNLTNTMPAKPVALTNVYLGNNLEQNMIINSLGAVTWTNGGSYDSNYGVFIDNSSAAVPGQPVTVTNVDFRGTYQSHGLQIFSAGAVNLTSIEATGNAGSGVMVDNRFSAAAPVTVNNTARGGFYQNGYMGGYGGLWIETYGPVTLTNVESQYNSGSGIYVDGCDGANAPVTITYTKEMSLNNNGGGGIFVQTNGAIKLTTTSKLHVNENNWDGIYLYNNYSNVAPVNVEGMVNGVSLIRLESNSGNGLEIFSKGAVTVRNVSVYYSGYDGIYVGGLESKPTSVTMTNIVAQQNGYADPESYKGSGIDVSASGPVTLFNLNSNQSCGNGLVVETNGVVSLKKMVSMYNGTGYSYNLWGVKIVTPANVILDSIYSKNDDNGVFVDTTGGSGTITMLGTYFKNEILNTTVLNGTALVMFSNGNISATRLDIRNTTGDIQFNAASGSITLNSVTAQNNMYGIYATAGNGAVFNKVVSMNNGGFWDANYDDYDELFNSNGITLSLYGGKAAFTDSVFTGNYGSGIEVDFNDPAVNGVPFPLTMTRTLYFGNDSDNGGDHNLEIYDL